MLEPLLHARLQHTIGNLVGGTSGSFSSAYSSAFNLAKLGRVYPVKAATNSDVPHVIYTVTSTKPSPLLNGSNAYTEYIYNVETYGEHFNRVLEIAEGVRAGLHVWRSSEVMLSTMTDAASEYDELGYAYSQDFAIKVRD